MKPSEKLKELGYVDDTELSIYKKLDKRFIDKEELKKKLKQLNLYSYDEERILKLLEE